MDERISKLAEKARTLPNPRRLSDEDEAGTVVYIGRPPLCAIRVGSYFQKIRGSSHKKIGMLSHIADFETIDTDSEVEALLARIGHQGYPAEYNAHCWTTKPFLI